MNRNSLKNYDIYSVIFMINKRDVQGIRYA